ncbi:GspH/FimT family pseudopilin [Pseudomonas sp. FME51]|uniref:GspH/FimT family pseudopilin n=1 Tax=Pseudomonas sp. FME51 TaxID=2742609 RepID=UPI00186808D3|nr:GspH/FimT family pseudopilin [Pseudomonas sp. FME51]
MDRVKGFTLVELMVTIVVAAILLGIAVPSFQTLSRNNAVKATTNDLMSTVNLARQQAMSTRSNIEIRPAAGGWDDGWSLEFTNDAMGEDADFLPKMGVTVARTEGNGALAFFARGGIQGGGAEFTVSHSDTNITSRVFCVSFFGKITQGGCS